MSAEYNALVDGRGDPFTRRVLDDWRLERGIRPGRLGVELWVAAYAAYSDADADAAEDDAYADAAYAVDASADASVDASVDASADAAADADATSAAAYAAYAAAAIRSSLHKLLTTELDMRDGLKLIQVPGRYGYSVTLVGRVRRISGDEFDLHGAVTVSRTGNHRMDGLQRLASEGPKGYDVTKPAKTVEEIHRLTIRRALVADEKAWAEACPVPASWLESKK